MTALGASASPRPEPPRDTAESVPTPGGDSTVRGPADAPEGGTGPADGTADLREDGPRSRTGTAPKPGTGTTTAIGTGTATPDSREKDPGSAHRTAAGPRTAGSPGPAPRPPKGGVNSVSRSTPSASDEADSRAAAARSDGPGGAGGTGPAGAGSGGGTGSAPAPRRSRTWALTVGLVAGLLILVPVAAGIGAYPIPVGDVVSSVQHRIGLGGAGLDRVAESVLWNVRLPRIVLALLVGASLGCAGALMQGVFGNPLAEPGVIGISSGAAVGAVAAISLNLTFLGTWTTSVFAFVLGLATVLLVYGMSRANGRSEVVTLILTGIAVNAFAGALIGLFVFFADAAAVNQITFWQLGSLAQATWPKVLAVLPCALLGLAVAPLYARRLDLLALGERPARHLGVDVERLRIVLILVIALLTAAAVSVSGIISFVGLVVPHLLRMAAGPGHRFLIPGSALLGALVLVAADLAARTLAAPAELPLGVLTALLGSPFFFWLLRRTRRRQGGWA